MFKIQTFNKISPVGLEKFATDKYLVNDAIADPDAILLRSHALHGMQFPASLLAVARSGVGVNNIPIDELTHLGIPVFNTPGANANAVKELVIAGMLLSCRNLCQAWSYTKNLTGDDSEINSSVEQNKKAFVGFELPGKKLAVIGLGAIGVKVANAALALGMEVIGYDPAISIQRAWELSAQVEQASSLKQAVSQADFVTVHVPYCDATHHLIDSELLRQMPKHSILLNFARAGIVDQDALAEQLTKQHIAAYVSDFPAQKLLAMPQVIALPHLGASTKEAEENCAARAASLLVNYLEHAHIESSVNFPNIEMPRNHGARIAVANRNVPNMVGQISTALGAAKVNIVDMINKSQGDMAYTLVDVDGNVDNVIMQHLQAIDGVVRVRHLPQE